VRVLIIGIPIVIEDLILHYDIEKTIVFLISFALK